MKLLLFEPLGFSAMVSKLQTPFLAVSSISQPPLCVLQRKRKHSPVYSQLKASRVCTTPPRADHPQRRDPRRTHDGKQHVVQEQSHKHHHQHQLPGLSPLLQQPLRGVRNRSEHGEDWAGLSLLQVLREGPLILTYRSSAAFTEEGRKSAQASETHY